MVHALWSNLSKATLFMHNYAQTAGNNQSNLRKLGLGAEFWARSGQSITALIWAGSGRMPLITAYQMAKKIYFRETKSTLVQTQINFMLLQHLEHLLKMLQVFLWSAASIYKYHPDILLQIYPKMGVVYHSSGFGR
jgi:hypothetical protein